MNKHVLIKYDTAHISNMNTPKKDHCDVIREFHL